jgi:hypothetical protein
MPLILPVAPLPAAPLPAAPRPRHLLPPLLLLLLLAFGGAGPAHAEAWSGAEDDLACRDVGLRFEMDEWVIRGVCIYRYCQLLDDEGEPVSLGGIPLAWFEADCGPLDGTEMDDAPAGFH